MAPYSVHFRPNGKKVAGSGISIGENHRCICFHFCARAAIQPDTRSHFSMLLLGPFRFFKARIASLDNSLCDNQLRNFTGIDLRESQVRFFRFLCARRHSAQHSISLFYASTGSFSFV